jgi:hypothetical protein
MTSKPKKKKTAKAARKVVVKAKPKAKSKAAKAAVKPHPLDSYILGAAKALELKIDPAWMPSVRANLDVTLKMGALVASLPLDDEAEPAPVFGA